MYFHMSVHRLINTKHELLMLCVYPTQYNMNANVTKQFHMQEKSVTHRLLIVYSL